VAHILTPTLEPPTLTPVVPTATITSIAKGETIVITSVADSGSGTLRQALLDAQSGDIITFDPTVFPPGDPATIQLKKRMRIVLCQMSFKAVLQLMPVMQG
jgi:hypothetical protein